jgi:hypothetical protein
MIDCQIIVDRIVEVVLVDLEPIKIVPTWRINRMGVDGISKSF